MGCFPLVKALYSPKEGDCIKKASALGNLHNIALSKALKRLGKHLQGFKYIKLEKREAEK